MHSLCWDPSRSGAWKQKAFSVAFKSFLNGSLPFCTPASISMFPVMILTPQSICCNAQPHHLHNHRSRGRRWRKFDSQHTAAVLKLLSDAEVAALRALCGRCLYHTLNHDLAAHGNAFEHVFVATGDIDAQWLRDSAVQLAIYLPRITAHPIIRPVSDPVMPCLPCSTQQPRLSMPCHSTTSLSPSLQRDTVPRTPAASVLKLHVRCVVAAAVLDH
jgi:hypothetical protein